MRQVTKLAPRIALEIFPWDDTVFRRLETNALDLALWVDSAPGELKTQLLFQDSFMCLVRKDHPIGKQSLTLKRYLSYPHAMVILANQQQGVVDRALAERGLARKVQLKIPYFASAAWIIEHSDMILTVPKRLAGRLAEISETRTIKPPIELEKFQYIQVWHPRANGDPAHQWLRRMFAAVSAEV
jgi:DNA-binding transcriptional LysR family regulator